MAALLLLLGSLVAVDGMMRETVERTVMIRKIGSDLQPESTGFIYKRDHSGVAKVITLGENDVNKHFDNLPPSLYEQPASFAAPAPVAAGPFHDKEDGEKSASDAKESYTIPVVEDADEHDDFGKFFEKYADGFGDFKSDFGKDFGHFEDDGHHEEGGGQEYGSSGHAAHGDKGHKGYASSHSYGKGGAGDYHTEKYESYSVSGGGGYGKKYGGADSYGSDYAKGHKYDGSDHGHKASHSKGEETDGFHKIYDKNEFKKDHDFYDGGDFGGGYKKYGHGYAHHGSEAGKFEKGDSGNAGYGAGKFGKYGHLSKGVGEEEEAGHSSSAEGAVGYHDDKEHGSEGKQSDGKGYGFEVKH
ncbi:hypothetical protein EVAR_31856_1 [Eumeta japonica]|uniref:Uncharacterized protein n=1 Tax=Eumeta variegata TaxID=151549 RepID=A0A4C1Z381_EUMVA|nr:hypothetical protein EVAR_31856_1 [Eumeta japonica]